MTKTGNGATELPSTANEIAWRHFWLANVIVDAAKPEPVKLARREMWTRKDSLTRRLHKLRRMRATLDLPH
jgi:hypothetical protein